MEDHQFNPSEPDGMYGDPDELLFSLGCGAEDLHYKLKDTHAQEWLAKYSGSTGSNPQEPQALPDLEDELRPADTSWDC